jgi:predicted dehydrogenase
LKIALLGCGVAIEHHLAALRGVPDIELAWFCDKDQSKAKRAMEMWGKGGLTAPDFDTLIEQAKPHVVHICTPPGTHAHFAVKAMEAGCHVLLEKPMATSPEEAERILEARDRSGCALCVMHNHMFDPPIIRVRELVERGTLGELVFGEGRYFLDIDKMAKEGMDRPDHWALALRSGIAGEYTPHTIYLLQSFFGPCQKLQLMHRSNTSLIEQGLPRETFAIQLSFENALGRIFMMDCMPYGHFSIDLYGTRATVHINMMDLTYRIGRIRSGLPLAAARMGSTFEEGLQSLWQTLANATRIATGRLKRRPGHRALVHAFYQSLRNGNPVPISGEEGIGTVRTIDMLDSAMAGLSQPVL